MAKYGPKPLPVAYRMWRLIQRTELGCWEWQGLRTSMGYGRVKFGGAARFAHRVMYELLVEPIPEGLVLDHLCRNPPCVNPAHLEPVTQATNTRRGMGHGSEVTCPRGHAYDDENLYVHKGKRYCRICKRESDRARYRRHSVTSAR